MFQRIRDVWKRPARAEGGPVVELLGAPDDRGVENVGGRTGARQGPALVRETLGGLYLGLDGALTRVQLRRGVDVPLGRTIEIAHERMRRLVADRLARGITPLLLGGGNDYGYPHVAGAADAFDGRVALVNVDAHLDVRPTVPHGITSGSPFYLALEERVVKAADFVELGIQEHCNDASLFEYVRSRGVRVITLDEARRAPGGPAALFARLLRQFGRRGLRVVVSFDVDGVQMAHAPGVSAPQSDGFTATDFLAMAAAAGAEPAVATVGFFEMAPALDLNGQTTRLVATAVHRYLSAMARRGGASPSPPGGRRGGPGSRRGRAPGGAGRSGASG